MKKIHFIMLTIFLFISKAQEITLVNNINLTGDSNISLASKKIMIEFNGNLYFTDDEGVSG